MTQQQKNKRDLTLRFLSGIASPIAVLLITAFFNMWWKSHEADKVDKAEMKQFMRDTHSQIEQLQLQVSKLKTHDEYLTEHGVFIGRPLTYSGGNASSGRSTPWK